MKYRRDESYFGRFYRITCRNHDIKCERSFLIRTILRTTNFCFNVHQFITKWERESERKEYVRALNTSILSSIGHTHTPVDDHFKKKNFEERERERWTYLVVDPQTTFEVLLRRVLASFWDFLEIFEKFKIWKKSKIAGRENWECDDDDGDDDGDDDNNMMRAKIDDT